MALAAVVAVVVIGASLSVGRFQALKGQETIRAQLDLEREVDRYASILQGTLGYTIRHLSPSFGNSLAVAGIKPIYQRGVAVDTIEAR